MNFSLRKDIETAMDNLFNGPPPVSSRSNFSSHGSDPLESYACNTPSNEPKTQMNDFMYQNPKRAMNNYYIATPLNSSRHNNFVQDSGGTLDSYAYNRLSHEHKSPMSDYLHQNTRKPLGSPFDATQLLHARNSHISQESPTIDNYPYGKISNDERSHLNDYLHHSSKKSTSNPYDRSPVIDARINQMSRDSSTLENYAYEKPSDEQRSQMNEYLHQNSKKSSSNPYDSNPAIDARNSHIARDSGSLDSYAYNKPSDEQRSQRNDYLHQNSKKATSNPYDSSPSNHTRPGHFPEDSRTVSSFGYNQASNDGKPSMNDYRSQYPQLQMHPPMVSPSVNSTSSKNPSDSQGPDENVPNSQPSGEDKPQDQISQLAMYNLLYGSLFNNPGNKNQPPSEAIPPPEKTPNSQPATEDKSKSSDPNQYSQLAMYNMYFPVGNQINWNLFDNSEKRKKYERKPAAPRKSYTGEKPYKCDVCDYASNKSSHLIRHQKIHGEARAYECTICGRILKQKEYLDAHMRIHNLKTPFKCEICGYATNYKHHLIRHRTKHTGEKPFKCEICPYACTSKDVLVAHQRIHTGEKPFKCSICDFASCHKSYLRSHLRTHSGEKPYKCDQCKYATYFNSALVKHFRIHTGEKPYKCNICGFASRTKSTLNRHMTKHTGEKPHKCETCGYAFSQKSQLIAHRRTHTGEKPFKCDECSCAYYQLGGLTSHKKTHSGEKPFECDICGYATTQRCHLARHKRRHTGDKPFKCHYCDYSSTEKHHVTKHIRTHTGEKPYKCTECPYASTQESHLIRHKKKHTGDRPHKCVLCGYTCSERSTLLTHVRGHTGEKMFTCDLCNYASNQKTHLNRHRKRKHPGEVGVESKAKPKSGTKAKAPAKKRRKRKYDEAMEGLEKTLLNTLLKKKLGTTKSPQRARFNTRLRLQQVQNEEALKDEELDTDSLKEEVKDGDTTEEEEALKADIQEDELEDETSRDEGEMGEVKDEVNGEV